MTETELKETIARIASPDEAARAAAHAHWAKLAKPLGGLGRLETMIEDAAALTGREDIDVSRRAVFVLCADNGVVAQGVSQTDQSVTRAVAERLVGRHPVPTTLLATGEMGIGNTTTSSAVAAALLGQPVERMTGRGAGLSDAGLARKIDAIRRGIAVNRPKADDPLDILAKLGGLDIAGLCGMFLGGAIHGIPIVMDGFISGVAALCAARLCPNAGKAALAVYQNCYSFAEGGIEPYTPQC